MNHLHRPVLTDHDRLWYALDAVEITDLALSILGTKTTSELRRPVARNILRAELMSQINAILGNGMVEAVYITELAIQ